MTLTHGHGRHPATELPVFDVCGPLPSGTTVLEASAGTGKTFTIAALAARYVAEQGVELGDLMLVTFGRAATSELRDRVRERLVDTERADRKSTRLNSSHVKISYAVFCLKKKKQKKKKPK